MRKLLFFSAALFWVFNSLAHNVVIDAKDSLSQIFLPEIINLPICFYQRQFTFFAGFKITVLHP